VTLAVGVLSGVTSGVALGVPVGVAGTVSVDVVVGVVVSLGVADARHPLRELSTAWRISLIVTLPSPFASKAEHTLTGEWPRAVLMPVTNSSMVTSPE